MPVDGTTDASGNDSRRDQLLRDAASFLARSPKATQSEIARALGVSRATLHRHFAGKDALVEALLVRAEGEIRDAAAQARLEEGPAEDALRRLVREMERRAPYMALIYTLQKEGEAYEDSEAWIEADAMIIAFFERGQRAQCFAPQLTATWMAESLYALTAAGEWAVQSGRCARRDVPSLIAELFWNGARAPRPE